jgi:4-amino-4-deoxy-L-arabinose transferase-like glycosyltransferase
LSDSRYDTATADVPLAATADLPRSAAGDVPPFATRPVTVIAGVLALVLAVVATRFDYFGDELYFIAAGHRLDWNYVDQPPLVPLIAALMDSVFPGSQFALRLPSVLACVASVVLVALIARELGGGRRAQVLAALASVISSQLLGGGVVLATTTLDLTLWFAIIWLVVRWVRTRHDRLLLWTGVLTAVDLQVKYLVVVLWLGIGIGVLISGPRELLRRPLLWVGAAIAVASAVPGLLWQAGRGWPVLEFSRSVAAEVNSLNGGRLLVLPLFVLFVGGVLAGTVLLVYGFLRLLRASDMAAYRFMGLATVVVLTMVMAVGGRYYYAAGMCAICWAAGAVLLERHRPAGWWRWSVGRISVALSIAVSAVTVLPLGVPAQSTFNLLVSGSTGWPQVTGTIATAYRALPAEQRTRTAVVTEAYWIAAAVDHFGPAQGLPDVYSGNRGYWYLAEPRADVDSVLWVGADAALPGREFDQVVEVAKIDNPGGVAAVSTDVRVWLCTGPRAGWPQLWPRMRQM